MCGLFGAIGTTINPFIIRTLTLLNRERGTDAIGFFASTGSSLKGPGDPLHTLSEKKMSKWLEEACNDSWFIAGHTRAGTRGGNTHANAHPFRYGKILGSHNGVVQAPYAYDVDSMWLFDLLHKHDNNYLEAFKDVSGSWALSWTDGTSLFLQSCGNPLAATVLNGTVYYSSEAEHLLGATGPTEQLWKFSEGETWKYTFRSTSDGADVEVLEKFPYIRRIFSSASSGFGVWDNSSTDRMPYYRRAGYTPFEWDSKNPSSSDPHNLTTPTVYPSLSKDKEVSQPIELMTKKERRKLRKQLRSQGLRLQNAPVNESEEYLFTPEEERQWELLERLEMSDSEDTVRKQGYLEPKPSDLE